MRIARSGRKTCLKVLRTAQQRQIVLEIMSRDQDIVWIRDVRILNGEYHRAAKARGRGGEPKCYGLGYAFRCERTRLVAEYQASGAAVQCLRSNLRSAGPTSEARGV